MQEPESWKNETLPREPAQQKDSPSNMSGDFSSGLGTGLGIALGILGATWLFTRLAK